MRRPGPLQELPLHLFTTDHPSNSSKTPVKRPHSPHAGDLLFSPSKRRILGEEGFLGKPSSPQRFSDSIGTSSTYSSRKARVMVLQTESGEHSYALHDSRKTGSRYDSPTHDATILRSQTSSFSSRRITRNGEMPMRERHSSRGEIAEGITTRRIASSPDRQSLHYPGFDVHWDEHISMAAVDDQTSQLNPIPGSEESKENVAPKRRTRKTDFLSNSVKPISKQKSKCGWDETRDSHEDTSKTPTQKSLWMGDKTFSQMQGSMGAMAPGSPTLKSLSRRPADIVERRNLLRMEIEGTVNEC